MMRAHDDTMLELAALRAIGALDADEAATIDRHTAECAECRAEFARASAASTAIALSSAMPPPAALRERVLAGARNIRRLRPWHAQAGWRAAAVAAAVLIGVGSWVATHRQVGQTWAAHCTASASSDCGELVAVGGVLRLDARGLSAPPAGKVYQAWVIPPKQQPVPEPTFSVSASGEGSVDIAAAPHKGDIIAVTVEPAGGSKAPTTKPVLVATIE